MEMMDEIFADFIAANKLIERDPVLLGETLARHTCERILPPDLRPDVLKDLRPRLAALSGRMKDCAERGKAFLIFEMIIPEFANELREWMNFEHRPGGRLHVVTQADEMKRCATAGYFERNLINGFEVQALADGIEPGEQIDIHAPAFHVIKTNKREIARGSDFFDRGRPAGYSKAFWLKKCTAADRLREAQEQLEREERAAARPRWNDSPESSAGPNVRPQ
jgi:hypothetical protein